MGDCIEKRPCEECGSNDALQVFQQEDGSYDGYCFACNNWSRVDGGDTPVDRPQRTEKDRQQEVLRIQAYGIHGLPDRGIEEETVRYFGVRVGVSGRDGRTPVTVFFPYGKDGSLTGWKARSLEDKKQQFCLGSMRGVDAFGWGRAIRSGAPKLIITEGEYDAMAMYQVLKELQSAEYKDNHPAVISLPYGAGSAKKFIANHKKEIAQHFKEVVLAFDMDEAGQKAAEEVCRIAPSYKVAKLPEKDANDCLLKGAKKALKAAVIFKADVPKNSRIVVAHSLHEGARQIAEYGLSTPWPKLTALSRGFRRGETWYWGAGVKMGKSEVVNTLGGHMIKEHGLPVMFVKPEEALLKTYKMLAGKVVGKIFHDPNIEFDYEAYDEAGKIIGELALFTDVYQFLNWDNLKEDIHYAVLHRDVRDIIIDPITCFTNAMSVSAQNEFLTMMAADISAMAKDLEFTAHLFCHLKAPEAGPPHERGGEVLSTQFQGSRAMMRSCNYMVGLEGNKDPELAPHERNRRTIKLLEDREFGATGIVPLYWDYKTGLFNELND